MKEVHPQHSIHFQKQAFNLGMHVTRWTTSMEATLNMWPFKLRSICNQGFGRLVTRISFDPTNCSCVLSFGIKR